MRRRTIVHRFTYLVLVSALYQPTRGNEIFNTIFFFLWQQRRSIEAATQHSMPPESRNPGMYPVEQREAKKTLKKHELSYHVAQHLDGFEIFATLK